MDLIFTSSTEVSSRQGRYFRVVILSEDVASTDKACDILRLLRRQLKREPGRLLYQWWNFAFLSVRELWDTFAAQTAEADMIIIGLHEELVFPERFAAWLQQLPELRRTWLWPGAMIAVRDASPLATEAEPEMFSQLQRAAVLSRMDFFDTRTSAGIDTGILQSPLRLAPGSLIRVSGN